MKTFSLCTTTSLKPPGVRAGGNAFPRAKEIGVLKNSPAPRPFQSLEDLYRKYSGMVYRLCLRYTRDRDDAEDMVSEVFMKLNRKMDQFRGESKPTVWIYRVAVNQCLDHLRSKRVRNELDLDELESESAWARESHLESSLARITLERILAKINPATRRILFLSHCEGLTNVEIAKVMGVTPDAVAKKLSRFSERMRREASANETLPRRERPSPSTSYQLGWA